MKYRLLMIPICGLILFCQLLAPSAFAADNLKDFFAPLVGTVIMPIGDKFLIDLDATKQIAQGDLLSVLYEGEKIIHPTSGEVLGAVHTFGAVLQITEVKSGYSYARVITGDQPVKRGDRVSRFENIPAYFLDESGQNAALFSKLKRDLPQLSWADYLTEAGAELFNHRPLLVIKPLNNNLAVIDQNNQIIQLFPVSGGVAQDRNPVTAMVQPKAVSPVAIPQIAPTSPPNQGSLLSRQETGLFAPPPRPTTEKSGGITRGSRFDSQIYAIALADFAGNGGLQVVVALEDQLVLGTFAGNEFLATTSFDLDNHQKILKLTTYDIDADGVPEILASGVIDQEIDSLILKVKNGQFEVNSHQNLLFNLIESTSGETVLVGQSKGDLLSYPPAASRLQVVGNKIKTIPYDLDPLTQIYGSCTIKSENGKPLQVMLTNNDNLKVVGPDKLQVWQSESYFGGSESALLYVPWDSYQDNTPHSFFLKAKMVATERNSVMLPRHEGSRILVDSPDYGSGQIVELYWNGFSLEETGSTGNLGGYVPDFDLVDIDGDGDQDLVAAVVYTKKGLFSKPVSGIVVIANER